MSADDRLDEFIAFICEVMSMWDKVLTPTQIGFWWDDLHGYDIDAIKRAFSAHRNDPDGGRFAPKPADILRHLKPALADEAVGEWIKVLGLARSGGGEVTNPIAREALSAMGGMGRIRLANESDNGLLQHQFCENYQAIGRSSSTQQLIAARPAVDRISMSRGEPT